MNFDLDTSRFFYDGRQPISLADQPNTIPALYEDKKDYNKILDTLREEINESQERMYAHDRYSLLLIFQAMDAAGKDSTIQSVMSGVNPHGVSVTPFKRPSDTELDHDFLWRTNLALPQRGTIGIFNRSYYEEVLVVRVHPEILTKYQRVPAEHLVGDLDLIWQQRYSSINHLEQHLHKNGTKILKFFLNVSKDEQARRFLSRIETPSKNWKFAAGDIEERGFWTDYQDAYEKCITATATPDSPWCIIPADDKKNMRLIVSKIVRDTIADLDTHYPKMDPTRTHELEAFRKQLEDELK